MEIETKTSTSSVKGSGADVIRTISFFRIRFNQFLLVVIHKKLYYTLAILHKFILHFNFFQNLFEDLNGQLKNDFNYTGTSGWKKSVERIE